MTIHETSNFSKKLERLVKRNSDLRLKIDRKLQLLVADSRNNSLRLHKINSRQKEAWSMSVDMKLRILFSYVDDGILLINIGGHDEVY